MKPIFSMAMAILLTSCTLQSDKYQRPRDLAPAWKVDKLRILAIQAQPPEIKPGEQASFAALLIDPEASIETTIWAQCSASEASSFGCPFDPTALDGADDPETLAAAGIIGIEPFLPPVYEAPLDILAGRQGRDLLEGVNVTVNALALPAESAETEEFDFNAVESAFKRFVVSEAETPNRNPSITALEVDGEPTDPESPILVEPGQEIEVSPILAEDAIETYAYLNFDGEREERVEEPFALWYTSDGNMVEDTTLHPFLPATWIAPSEPGLSGTIWVVLKDRRGGVTWSSLAWQTLGGTDD